MKSEFGRGFAYCLGLFLAHTERASEFRQAEERTAERDPKAYSVYPSLWFNGAADHLYELEIPDTFTAKEKAEAFKSKCLGFRLDLDGKCTWEDVYEAIGEAKMLLLVWDMQNGIPCCEAEWS